MIDSGYTKEHIGVREFPPFIRVTLKESARKELFSRAMRRIGEIRREYHTGGEIFDSLYGKEKGKILKLLSKSPQSAKTLIGTSGLSPSVVYHFLSFLKKRQRISKEGCTYSLEKSDSLYLDEIVRIEEDSTLRRRYGISIKELELAYTLWDHLSEVTSMDGGYGQTYHNEYTLADAIHRWRTGRTDIPVWALSRVVDISASDVLGKESVLQYHLPPGIPVRPHYEGEYRLPVEVDIDLDKIVIQLLQKLSRNHTYTFPKGRRWLFERLHSKFGDFDDSTSRVPSAIVEILRNYYELGTLNRLSARIPARMKARWEGLNPLLRIIEESSLLLHIISLSSKSNGGFEVTSPSRHLLEDVSSLLKDLGLGQLTVHGKHQRPHFRVYLSESKVNVLRRYTHLFEEYPDLELWLRIPLNQIGEKLVLNNVDPGSVELICREELSRCVESILRSLERKKRDSRVSYLRYKEKIADYFWQQRIIPSPRNVERQVERRIAEEEGIIYA